MVLLSRTQRPRKGQSTFKNAEDASSPHGAVNPAELESGGKQDTALSITNDKADLANTSVSSSLSKSKMRLNLIHTSIHFVRENAQY